MRRSEYLANLLQDLQEGKITKGSYEHGVRNADVFSDPDDEEENNGNKVNRKNKLRQE